MPNGPYTIDTLPPEIQSLVPGILVLGTPACLISPDERMIVVNQAYLDLTNRRAVDVLGKHLREFVTEPGYTVAKPHLDLAIKRGTPASFIRLWKSPAGEQKWINVTYAPVHGADGQLL